LLCREAEGIIHESALACPNLLGREKIVPLRQDQDQSSNDTVYIHPRCVRECKGLPGFKDRIIPFAWLTKRDSLAVAESGRKVGEVYTG
jgi:hypothetical protein